MDGIGGFVSEMLPRFVRSERQHRRKHLAQPRHHTMQCSLSGATPERVRGIGVKPVLDHVMTRDPRGAVVGREQRGEDADGRGLPGAVGPEQREELALRYGEIHAGERAQRTVALLDAPDFDGVQCCVETAGRSSSTP